MEQILDQVFERAGSAYKLALNLNIRPQAVYQWTRVPVERVLDVERLTGISRHRLRPDIYGDGSVPVGADQGA